jgi:replicative DNA helicase
MKNIELEEALLGCIINDSEQLTSVKSWITEIDFFYSEFNKDVWRVIIKLEEHDSDIDLNTVSGSLEKDALNKTPVYRLTEFMEMATSPSKAEGYAKILHGIWLRRKLDRQAYEISKTIKDDTVETRHLLEDAHTTIGNLIRLQPGKKFNMDNLLEATVESIFARTTLIKTGIDVLDSAISGMTRGEITIIAGRPGNAKTTIAANIARHLVHQGKKVVMFNREMPNTEMMKKFLAMESKSLLYRNLRHNVGLNNQEVMDTASRISELYNDKLFMFDDIRDLDGSFREIKAINPDVIIDDHIGLIEYPANDRRDLRLKIGDTTRRYKWLAKAQNMSVMLVSQMNRNVEYRNDRIPRLSDLAESGNLEQDAELVIFTHYPWVSRYGDDGNSECYLQLIVAKNRYGNTNMCEAGYHGNSCMVTNSEADAIALGKSRGDEIRGGSHPF